MLFRSTALALAALVSTPALAASPCQGFEMRETPHANSALPGETSFLWKVSKRGSSPSYLLGSFHTDTSKVLSQWESLIVLTGEMKSFVTETSFARSDRIKFGSLARAEEAVLPAALGPDFFPLAQSALREIGLDDNSISRLKPWAAFLQLAQPTKQAQSLDSFLYQQAAQLEIELVPLQNPEEMAASAETLSPADQARITKETLCNRETVVDQVRRLQEYYVAGDVAAFLAESGRLTSPAPGLTDRLFTALVSDRNRIFLPRLLPLLDRGDSLVAVGAGHLFGEGGLLRALRQKGYTVEAVDRSTLASALFARANQVISGTVDELTQFALDQGLELPSGSARPKLVFVPTPELETMACGQPCRVSLFPKGDKIYASVEIYNRLRQREPGLTVHLFSLLVQRMQAAQLAASGDRSCQIWRSKNIENTLLQGKYLESIGMPAGGASPPKIPRDCQ